MVSLLFVLFAALPVHADFVWVTYETTSFPSEACIDPNTPGSIQVDHVQSAIQLWDHAWQFNLSFDHNYFVGDGICRTKGTDRIFKVNHLFEGSPENIRAFVESAPTFSGQYLSFAYRVTPLKSLTAHYGLREKYDRERLADVLLRPVAGQTLEYNQFVLDVCRYPADNLKSALRGTPNELAAIDFLNKYPTSYQLQVELEMEPYSGAPFSILNGSIWGCTGF